MNSTAEDLVRVASERGWQVRLGPENKAHLWRQVYVARRDVPHRPYPRVLYGDPDDLVRRITADSEQRFIRRPQAKENNMSGKRNEGLQDDYIRAPRGVFSDSQSPQSRRGGSDDTEAFHGDRTVSMSDRIPGKTDDANPHAWDNLDALDIERHNPK